MKHIILIMIITLFSSAGFFNDKNEKSQAEHIENERLCKLFTEKVERYKKNMRDDILAKASLASYEHRATLFCKKAEESKKEDNITQDY